MLHRTRRPIGSSFGNSRSALLVAALVVSASTGSIAPFLMTPVAAVGAGVALYGLGARRPGPRGPLTNAGWQRAAVVLFVICLIPLPSAALFTATLSRQFGQLIVTEQEWIRGQQDDLVSATRVDARDSGYGPSRVEQLRTAALRYASCVPHPFTATAPAPSTSEPPQPAVPDVVRTSYVSGPQAADTSYRFTAGCDRPTAAGSGSARLHAVSVPVLGGVLRRLDRLFPIDHDIAIRQSRHDDRFTYLPAGTFTALPLSSVALTGLVLTAGLLLWWVSWNTTHLFLADLPSRTAGTSESDADVADLWKDCTTHEQMTLLQIAAERIANPYQRPTIERLLARGLLRLDPDVQPCSVAFDAFLRAQAQIQAEALRTWERVDALHSWRYGRIVLAVFVGGTIAFLFATQPGLQSSVIGIATGIAGMLTAGFKVRDAVATWFEGNTRPKA